MSRAERPEKPVCLVVDLSTPEKRREFYTRADRAPACPRCGLWQRPCACSPDFGRT